MLEMKAYRVGQMYLETLDSVGPCLFSLDLTD